MESRGARQLLPQTYDRGHTGREFGFVIQAAMRARFAASLPVAAATDAHNRLIVAAENVPSGAFMLSSHLQVCLLT